MAHLALNSQQCPECWAQPDAHPQHLVSEGRRVKTKAQVSYGHLVLELAVDAPATHLAAGVLPLHIWLQGSQVCSVVSTVDTALLTAVDMTPSSPKPHLLVAVSSSSR